MTTTVLGREYFLPTPTLNHERCPSDNKAAVLSSWSILFYGTLPVPAAGLGASNPPRKSKSRGSPPPTTAKDTTASGPLVVKSAVKAEEKPEWYAVSGAEELQNLANWLEGQVRFRVYQRKLDAYDKEIKKEAKDGSASSELSGLDEKDFSAEEAEEKDALEYMKEVKAFADFVTARQGADDEDEE